MFSMFLSSLDTMDDEASELSELFPPVSDDGELRHLSSTTPAGGGPYRVLVAAVAGLSWSTESGYVGVGATICCGGADEEDEDGEDATGTGYGAKRPCGGPAACFRNLDPTESPGMRAPLPPWEGCC